MQTLVAIIIAAADHFLVVFRLIGVNNNGVMEYRGLCLTRNISLLFFLLEWTSFAHMIAFQ